MDPEIAKLIQSLPNVFGNPRADAEARQYQMGREINQFKLDQARIDAEEKKKSQPAIDWIRTHMAGRPGVTADVEPISGDVITPGVDEIKPLFNFDPTVNAVRLDPKRATQFYSNLVAAYGPEALTKYHQFVGNTASNWPGVTEEQQNAATHGGIGAMANLIASPVMRKTGPQNKVIAQNAINKSLAEQKAAAEAQKRFGSVLLPSGERVYADENPDLFILQQSEEKKKSNPGAPSAQTSASPVANMISSSEGPLPSSEPSAATTESGEEGQVQQSDVRDFDPIDAFGSFLTKAKQSGATAENAAIRAQLAKAKPTGKLIGNRWVPDPIPVPPVVKNEGQTPAEASAVARMIRNSLPDEKADLADQQWVANAMDLIKRKLTDDSGNDQKIPETHAMQLAYEMDDLRKKLVADGWGRVEARSIAENTVFSAFLKNFRINDQPFGKAHVANINDRFAFGGGGASGNPLTPEEIASLPSKKREQEDRNRGLLGYLLTGGADHVTVADMANNTEFRNQISQGVGKLPNMYTKSDTYVASGNEWLASTHGITAESLAEQTGRNVSEIQNDLKQLMFLEDIRRNGVEYGYAKKLPDKSGIVRMRVTQDDIDKMIVPQIEALKAKISGSR